MIELIDLAFWVAQIKAECPVFENRVFKTIPDDELSLDLLASPAVFIYLSADDSTDSSSGSTIKQRMASTISVEIMLRRTASQMDQYDDLSVDNIRQYRQAVFNALLGWMPDDGVKRVLHKNGRLKKKDKKQINWVDDYATESLIAKKIIR